MGARGRKCKTGLFLRGLAFIGIFNKNTGEYGRFGVYFDKNVLNA